MITDPNYILCQDCRSLGHNQVLGKLTETGSLIIMRNKNGTTIINATTYDLLCGCGYRITITGGAITNGQGQGYKYTPVTQ